MESEKKYMWVQQCLLFLGSFKAKWNLLLSSTDLWPAHKDYVGPRPRHRLVNQGESGNSQILKVSYSSYFQKLLHRYKSTFNLDRCKDPVSFPIYCSSLSGMLYTSLHFFFSLLVILLYFLMLKQLLSYSKQTLVSLSSGTGHSF